MTQWSWIAMDHSESLRFCNAQMSSVSLFVQSMFRMHSRLCRDLSAFFCAHSYQCVCACVWVGILCLLGCQPKSGEVTGPDRKIDRPTGSWTRDGFGSANWTVKAAKPFKKGAGLSDTFTHDTLKHLCAPMRVTACVPLICFFISNTYSPSGHKS